MISTDSEDYAAEARRHGLSTWFLRPKELSTDSATAIDATAHALLEAERHTGKRFEIILIIEPTSPLRRPVDVESCISLAAQADVQSVVSVSRVDKKYHPQKLLTLNCGLLRYSDARGEAITGRQQLANDQYIRNGVCYALRRDMLLGQRRIFGDRTIAYVIDRPIVNIDEPIELELAEFLLGREAMARGGGPHAAAEDDPHA
jgi:CMP-N-acetylneuraminic acid synthetase